MIVQLENLIVRCMDKSHNSRTIQKYRAAKAIHIKFKYCVTGKFVEGKFSELTRFEDLAKESLVN